MFEDHISPSPPLPYSLWKVTVVSIAFLSFLVGLLWIIRRSDYAPEFSPGIYGGELGGLHRFSASHPFVLRVTTTGVMAIISGESLVKGVGMRPPGPKEGDALPPLEISFQGAMYRFSGVEDSQGGYQGTVKERGKRDIGWWRLKPIEVRPLHKDVLAWGTRFEALENVTAQQNELERAIGTKGREIGRLTEFLSAGKTLRQQVDSKFEKEENILAEVRKRYEQRLNELGRLRQQRALTEQLSPYGRLVALTRQSFEKEAQWFFARVGRSDDENAVQQPPSEGAQ